MNCPKCNHETQLLLSEALPLPPGSRLKMKFKFVASYFCHECKWHSPTAGDDTEEGAINKINANMRRLDHELS